MSTTYTSTTQDIGNELQAMEAIVTTLDALPKDQRNRIIRWLCERYGVGIRGLGVAE